MTVTLSGAITYAGSQELVATGATRELQRCTDASARGVGYVICLARRQIAGQRQLERADHQRLTEGGGPHRHPHAHATS
jgi:hypothetical protein